MTIDPEDMRYGDRSARLVLATETTRETPPLRNELLAAMYESFAKLTIGSDPGGRWNGFC